VVSGVRRWAACLLAATVAAAGGAGAQPPGRAVDVLHYDARVQPDLGARTVTGTVTIRLRVLDAPLTTFGFDRGALVVDTVTVSGRAARFETPERRLVVHLIESARSGDAIDVTVVYHGAPPNGLVFAPERRQVYTIFSTRQWLVCVDEPGDKATLDLRVTLPDGLVLVASGDVVGRRAAGAGITEHHWRTTRPVSTFTMAFAAGPFAEASARHGTTALRYLGEGLTAAELARAFADTAGMLTFFADRAGVPYPGSSYSQVLVADTVGQEAAGFAMLSEAYGRRLLGEPAALSLAAHELAHQWLGVLVTCADWRHFWLNEGLATFMAAAYVEHRFGRDAYLRHVDGWRATLARLDREGGNRPLVFPDWNRPSANDRAVVYEKGAYVMHVLREELGDRAFWDAMRHFVRTSAGGVVTTHDFQRRVEESAGRSLAPLFATWVYGAPQPPGAGA
jgi:aminopeptidase N